MQQVSQRRTNRAAAFLTSRKVVPYVFVAPFVIYFLLIYLYPTVSTVLMSFQRIDGPTTSEWIGLKNYQKLFSRNFIQALETSTRYAVWDVIVLTIVPLLFAVLLHSGLVKGSIPALTSIIVAGIVFRLAFGTQDTAPVNAMLTALGGQPRQWLMFADSGNFVLIVMTLWRWMGVNIIYYLSGIQAIPNDLYEAAEIDGANPIQKFFKVTLPGIRPVLIYVITITVLGGFAMFTESVALWQQSNPGGIGRTIVGYLYQVGITKANMGMASAVGLTLLALVLVVNLIQLVLMGFFRKEDA